MVMWGKGLGGVSHDGVGWGCVGGVFWWFCVLAMVWRSFSCS